MERHFSTGVMTIVALMTAHRNMGGEEPRAFAEMVARINTYLAEKEDSNTSRRVTMPAE